MLNTHSQWRIEFARQLAAKLKPFQGIKAVVIAGSVARGYADEYADIEIPLFWERLPSEARRRAIISALGGRLLNGYDGPAREDQLLIRGLQVDVWHVNVKHQEEIIQAVLGAERYDLGSLNALDTLRTCIPLQGDELVQSWKRRAQEFPEALARKIIQEHIGSFGMPDLYLFAQRDNPTAFYAQLSHIQQEVFLVLLALNRSYFPTFKWLYRALESMPVKPRGVEQRFRQAYQVSRDAAMADMKSLLEEMLALVERQFPDVDIEQTRLRLAYRRAAHGAPIEPEDRFRESQSG